MSRVRSPPTVKHGRRLSYLPLDFLKDEISGPYDVIWFSNVLHIYSAEDNQRVFQEMSSALNPGGRLLIQDAFLVDPHDGCGRRRRISLP